MADDPGSQLKDDAEPASPTYHQDPEPPEARRWSSFLPIRGAALEEQGFDLPLPIGLSTNYLRIERDIDVEDIKVGVVGNGTGPQSVNNFLQVDADSAVDVVIGRLDLWILPFLNVYGYGGWQWNDSSIDVGVTLPVRDWELPVRVWSGFNYYDTNTTIDGSVDVPGMGRVRFEVDQGPDNPWNGLVGVGLGSGQHIDAAFEYGFNFDDIQIFMANLTLRF